MDKPDTSSESGINEFIESLKHSVEKKSYPECDPTIANDLLRGIYIRDELYERNCSELAEDIDKYISKGLKSAEAIESISDETSIENLNTEEISWLETVHYWRESVGSFTRVDGQTIHGGDIINLIISSDDIQDGIDNLNRFKQWYSEDLERIEKEDNKLFSCDIPEGLDAKDLLMYNGLLMVVDRVEKETKITEAELRVP